ncbi:sugar transporter family protein [Sporormia fimetaria CBS 119925]|uniref:Sugar transporter family protein n=1 Tax=Sporormia fimetaria CBS 119925 TaxID=1340428 RepID=A0A6A6VF61_9PLEO|nr:sugar transporter family protein [Sporormia fimetaria CBS 119925]
MFGKQYMGLRGSSLNWAISIIAGVDFFLFGYDQGVMGGLLTLGSFVRTFPEIDVSAAAPEDRSHVSTIQGIAVASYNVGCFLGAILCIWVGDLLGRRKTIFVGSSIMIIGAAIKSSTFSLDQFIVGRIITGIGNGMNTSTVPTWQSETCKSHRRGMMVMIEGALITGGIAFSYWLDFGFSFLDPSTIAWRFPLAFQIVFALLILVFILELPESPRWLILKGRDQEAIDVLAALSDLSTDDQYIQDEYATIKDTVIEAAQFSFKDLFTMTQDRHFHRVVLAYVNQVFQQITGINLISYYATFIFEQTIGLSPFLSRILAAANGTEYFAASWIAVFTIERYGRRSLMIFGAIGQAASMAILAGATSKESTTLGIVATVFLFVFNTFFAIGWLGMTWLYPAEIVPLKIRAPANALSTSANWAFNFMVVMITPVAFETIGYKTYVIFAVINAVIAPVVYFFYPETAYRSLEEMDTIFHKTTSVFNVVSVARNEPRRYGKNGELLIRYEDTEQAEMRRRSVTSASRKEGVGQGLRAEEGKGVMAKERMEGSLDEKKR